MTIHSMIDLETLGNTPDAVIVSIGGIKFDPNGLKMFDAFHFKLDVDQQTEAGRTIDESTIEWWGKQDPAVIEEALGDGDRVAIPEFLDFLKKWCVGVDGFWSQGPTFDLVMLENMYRQNSKPYPWPFWKIRDSRTLFGIMPTDPRKQLDFEAHNALEDCKAQAKCVQYSLDYLGLTIK